ncbi:hypothetical protein MNBD_DELTA01-1240 [hydrothermal vent metagenome]|uniref:Outer-membrane lipoprotein carrier protein n=1 Tax=hydrothermal vent metagenome TaxID=652676 RepID=A0A3B0R2W9_9ZZZZ
MTIKIKTNIRSFWVGFFLILAVSFLFAEPSGAAIRARDIMVKVAKRYSSIGTLSARFRQEAFYRGLNQRRVSEGRVFLKVRGVEGGEEVPAMMRWEYEFPTKDVIVSDGITLWMYQPDIMQVVETDASRGPMPVIMRLLTGFSGAEGAIGGGMEDDFLMDIIRDGKDSWGVSMAPTYDEGNFHGLVVEINKKTYLVEGVKVVDHYGVETRVSLMNIKINPEIADNVFRFDLPKGVTVVRP